MLTSLVLSEQQYEDLNDLVAACEREFGAEGEWDDDEDVMHPPSGITFGMIRRAREAMS